MQKPIAGRNAGVSSIRESHLLLCIIEDQALPFCFICLPDFETQMISSSSLVSSSCQGQIHSPLKVVRQLKTAVQLKTLDSQSLCFPYAFRCGL